MELQGQEELRPSLAGGEGVTENYLWVGGRVGPVRGCFPGKSGFSHGEHPKNLLMHSCAQLGFSPPNLPPFQVQHPVSHPAPRGWS